MVLLGQLSNLSELLKGQVETSPDQSRPPESVRSQPRLKQDQVEELVRAYAAGASSAELEQRYGIHNDTDADPGGWLTVCLGCEAWDDGRSDPRRRGYEREEAAAFVDAG